jgi:uncharacterized protein YkwD
MRGWRVLCVLALLFALPASTAGARACPGAKLRLDGGNAAKVRAATVCLLNRRRADAGLKALGADHHLTSAATDHSSDMVARQYFAHDGPGGDTLASRVTSAGYLTGDEHAWGLAENLAYGGGGRGTASAIVRMWMHSPLHRANVLLARARDAGVGLAASTPSGGDGTTFTLDLGYAH